MILLCLRGIENRGNVRLYVPRTHPSYRWCKRRATARRSNSYRTSLLAISPLGTEYPLDLEDGPVVRTHQLLQLFLSIITIICNATLTTLIWIIIQGTVCPFVSTLWQCYGCVALPMQPTKGFDKDDSDDDDYYNCDRRRHWRPVGVWTITSAPWAAMVQIISEL